MNEENKDNTKVNCYGGCRAASLYKYGELNNSDDNCFLEEI